MSFSSIKKEGLTVIKVYGTSWILIVSLIAVLLMRRGDDLSQTGNSLASILPNPDFLIAFHLLFLLILGLFYVIRYFVRVYQKKGRNIFFKQLGYRFVLPVILIVAGFKILIFANTEEDFDFEWKAFYMNNTGISKNHYPIDGKHRGMSVFGWNTNTNDIAIDALIKTNVEWVAVIPFIYQEDETTKTVDQPDTQGWSRRDSIFINAIKTLHKKGLHVQLKPHVWTGSGWRSNLNPGSKTDWDAWFSSYETRILRYAKMAGITGAELFCIGTELKTSIKAQPERWEQLIQKVRELYSGKITYAANWHDEYEHINFWDQLDFIGIQAYFPLTKNKLPQLSEIETGWKPHIAKLEELHQTYKKPILFTEVGYRSDATATIKPWEWGSYLSVLSNKKSDRTQQRAYEALFTQLWDKEWFAGTYIWQWDTRTKETDTHLNLDFSPRFKPAGNTLAKWYGKSAVNNTTNE